jgi:hypothetical protein
MTLDGKWGKSRCVLEDEVIGRKARIVKVGVSWIGGK